ncbi:hypothetical protein ABTE65_19330, partial [Acinetobacter baumannii]
ILQSADIAALTAFAAKDMYPAMDPLQDVLGKLVQVQLDIAKAEYEHAETLYRRMTVGFVVALVVGTGLALALGIWVIRS